jgi:hypothetical protein
MELEGDVGLVKSCFGPFCESASVSASRRTVCAKHTVAHKSFWMHPMVLLGDVTQVDA